MKKQIDNLTAIVQKVGNQREKGRPVSTLAAIRKAASDLRVWTMPDSEYTRFLLDKSKRSR